MIRIPLFNQQTLASSHNLQRFLSAQETTYQSALSEIKAGRKRTHWMWFIFPQIQGLGFSETSRLYAIKDVSEAKAYVAHPVLGSRLVEISNELLQLPDSNATQIFGNPDDMKLKSCMTLFAAVPDAHPVFEAVLNKFFNATKDDRTMRLLKTA